MKNLLLILLAVSLLSTASFTMGFFYCRLKTIDRAEIVLKEHKTEITPEDINYIVLNKK